MSSPHFIQSRDNPLVKEIRRLAQDPTAYRKHGRVWLEGDHLCRAALQRGHLPDTAVFCESLWTAQADQWQLGAARIIIVPDALFASLSTLESPGRMGFLLGMEEAGAIDPQAPAVVLDGLQDAGNVGAILRSAGAFGFRQILSIKGTAALWSPKVLRAGMGAHFGLRLIEGLDPKDVSVLRIPLIATSSHQGEWLHRAKLPWPCAWLMGHEGQGVGAAMAAQATDWVRIIQPGGEESLNVAAAAAICLHASAAAQDLLSNAGRPSPG